MKYIYFDNAASTKMREEVVEFMLSSFRNDYANPSAVHALGVKSRALLENARSSVAKNLNVKSQDIIFTSGATESNNLAIRGVIKKSNKKEIICSSIEHSSIRRLMYALEDEGYKIKFVPVKPNGIVDIDKLKEAVTSDTGMVILMGVNNETGSIQPIKEVGEFLKGKDIHFHVDAVQMITKIDFNPYELGINSMSASAHKFYGPKGVGILYIQDDVLLAKDLHGGFQERNKRAGTENLNSILGTVKALEIAFEKKEEERAHIHNLMKTLTDKLANMPNIKINGENRIDNILNIQVEGKNIQLMLPMLDMRGICVSGGSACMSGSLSGSNVLKEMGLTEEENHSSIRISLGIYNTIEEIDYFVECLEKI